MMKFMVKYADETVKIINIKLKEYQGDIDGFLMAIRAAPSFHDSEVMSIEKVVWRAE